MKRLEELTNKIAEELISLENEKETFEEAIREIEKALREKRKIDINGLLEICRYFNGAEEDLVVYPELKDEDKKLKEKYSRLKPTDLKFYLAICNLLNILENYKTDFERGTDFLRYLKKLAEQNLQKVKKAKKIKDLELKSLIRFRDKIEEVKKFLEREKGNIRELKLKEYPQAAVLFVYFKAKKGEGKRRRKLVEVTRKGKYFELKKEILKNLIS
jgi:thymidine phosphorylase